MSLEAMVATLLLERADFKCVTAAADGGVLVELTDTGTQRLVDRAGRYAAALEERAERREAWLRSLTNDELVALASSRLGGPEPDVAAEGARRLREMTERLQPVLHAMRSLGLLGDAR
jgi:uncharacterized protein with GYD domain